MNTQSWLRAQLPWKTAVDRLRAGFTEVLSMGMEIRWMTVRVRPTVTPVRPTGMDRRLVEAMMKTNTAVKNTSASITAPSLKPPGEWMPYPLEAKPDVLALNGHGSWTWR